VPDGGRPGGVGGSTAVGAKPGGSKNPLPNGFQTVGDPPAAFGWDAQERLRGRRRFTPPAAGNPPPQTGLGGVRRGVPGTLHQSTTGLEEGLKRVP
jgi:hypothetical protein